MAAALQARPVQGPRARARGCSAPESLLIILAACAVTIPTIAVYTVFIHRVFHGKARLPTYCG